MTLVFRFFHFFSIFFFTVLAYFAAFECDNSWDSIYLRHRQTDPTSPSADLTPQTTVSACYANTKTLYKLVAVIYLFYHLSSLFFQNLFSLLTMNFFILFFTGALPYLRPEITWLRASDSTEGRLCVQRWKSSNIWTKLWHHLLRHILYCRTLYYWFLMEKWTIKEGTTRRNIRPKTLDWLWALLHQCCWWAAEMSTLNVVSSVELWPSAGATERHLAQGNAVTKHHSWTLPVESVWGQQTQIYRHWIPAFEPTLEGACLHILGPHEYIWNSMYLQINPLIVSAEGGKEKGFVVFIAFIWDLCVPHMERISRDRENKREQTNLWVLLYQKLYCTPQMYCRESSFKHSSYLLPLCVSLSLLSPFCLIDVLDGESGTPAFCSFREELGGGQGWL